MQERNMVGQGFSSLRMAPHAIRRDVPVLELTSVQGCETAFKGISLPMPMHVDGRRVTIDTAGHGTHQGSGLRRCASRKHQKNCVCVF